LIGAVREGAGDRALELLRNGADPNLPAGVNGWTPVMHAIHKGQSKMVELLLDHGADPSLRAGRTTPLLMAAGYGYTDMVETLLKKGADPRAKTDSGANALDLAVGGVPDIDRVTVGHCQTETVKLLLKAAPDLRLSDNTSGKLAKAAATAGRCGEVLALLDERR
jgi:hypothetical protein